MMRSAVLVVLVLMVSAIAVSAQTPFIAVYFDHTYQVDLNPPAPAGDPCPGMGVDDYLYIALVNANTLVAGVEFSVIYPPEIMWVADLQTQPVTIGTTPTGFSMGWPIYQFGTSAVFICEVWIKWQCENCDVTNIPIMVAPHPVTTVLGFVDFPDKQVFPAVGLTSLACATVPTEDTTWGQVKALYGE